MKSKRLIKEFMSIYEESNSLWTAGRRVVGSIGYWMLFFCLLQNLLQVEIYDMGSLYIYIYSIQDLYL